MDKVLSLYELPRLSRIYISISYQLTRQEEPSLYQNVLMYFCFTAFISSCHGIYEVRILWENKFSYNLLYIFLALLFFFSFCFKLLTYLLSSCLPLSFSCCSICLYIVHKTEATVDIFYLIYWSM